MPLYLKILDFFDRHYNYKLLVKAIIQDTRDEREKAFKILQWTNENIRPVPEGMPIIDDHVWHIIVRGYGTHEQSQDVFTTLCNYAGMDAFFYRLYTKDKSSRIPLSFVKIDKKWFIFDAYYGIYFKKGEATLASIEDISRGDWIAENIAGSNRSKVRYADYLQDLGTVEYERYKRLARANIQSPLNRLYYQINKVLKRK
jgi:hypothetical protein